MTKGGWAFFVLCLLVTAGAYNAGLNMSYLLASLLIAVFGVSILAPVWNVGRLDCRRAVRNDVYAEEPFPIELTTESRRHTAARTLRLEEPLAGQNRRARKLVLRVAPHEIVRATFLGAPRPRGAYQAPPIHCVSGFPFGVAEAGISYHDTKRELLVLPARGVLSNTVSNALKPRGSRAGSPSRTGMPGEDFRSLRDYQPGDNPHWIHWRATAHHGKLFVREMERERSAPVLMVLDSRLPKSLPPERRAAGLEALELAISFAAEVCRVAEQEGCQPRLVAWFPEPRAIGATAGSHNSGLRLLLQALARLQPSEEESTTELIALAQKSGLGSAWRVIAVTPLPETAGPLAADLGRAAERVYVSGSSGFSQIFHLRERVAV